jgi:hypothetical protein
MMKLHSLLPVALAACGCVSAESVARHDIDTYGTRVIRPGTPKAEVDALFQDSGNRMSSVGAVIRNDRQYPPDVVVAFDFKDRVRECWPQRCTEYTDVPASMDAQTIHAHLREGMEVAEVRRHFGTAAAAYENESGTVVCIYPQPGIAVTFLNDRVITWRFHHLYRSKSHWPENDIANYGTRIIRREMERSEVEEFLNQSGEQMSQKNGTITNTYRYSDTRLQIDYDSDGRVEGIEFVGTGSVGVNVVRDMVGRIGRGMTPSDVQQVVGKPIAGFEDRLGHVCLVYLVPSNGWLAVEFVGGKVLSASDR